MFLVIGIVAIVILALLMQQRDINEYDQQRRAEREQLRRRCYEKTARLLATPWFR